ncbi:replication initiation protein [Shewanella surugensis]|uniref:Replication initiation protein n=1 Tax=Shewanella surugensis TaxID=212020 RepID=A0ABT0LK64_9GAMM|nr:replication initiation protein [Shewanella surugensis]
MDELNNSSDLTVEYETIKKGRSVAALSFQFTQDKQRKLKLTS